MSNLAVVEFGHAGVGVVVGVGSTVVVVVFAAGRKVEELAELSLGANVISFCLRR